MAALDLEDVRKVYGTGESEVVALDHATLEVADDEIVVLLHAQGPDVLLGHRVGRAEPAAAV